jgi:predicted CoA-substrate-specific enzyme activase
MTVNHGSDALYAGVDVGSVSVNAVVIDRQKSVVFEAPYLRHLGRIEETVLALIRGLFERFGRARLRSVALTGAHGQRLSERLGTFYEFETISQVLGVLAVVPNARSIISMGGQEASLYGVDHFGNGWELAYFNTNGPCAAGTGSFIDQQAERLATRAYENTFQVSRDRIDRVLSEFIGLGLKSDHPAGVACRCTVFTKSDMIHLQNRGERLADIIHGLHMGNARNYVSTIVGNRDLESPIVFVGGLSLNALQVKAFLQFFPDMKVPPFSTSVGALGVALKALEMQRRDHLNPDRLTGAALAGDTRVARAPRLGLQKTAFSQTGPIADGCRTDYPVRAYLGIDIGSTSTKYALIDEEHRILDKCYRPTRAKPIEVTQELLTRLRKRSADRLTLLGIATTGSGRTVVGDFLDADLVIDEITAHAGGAVEIEPDVDTVFEIGGQDSKYIQIDRQRPMDFDMNKVCAAGTGSFLHELAGKFGINIVDEFQELALSAQAPVQLAERCTVFMESDLISYYQKNVPLNDLLAGLCYAVVHNYLNRVVGKRAIGDRVMFLGGPSLNMAVVAAFEKVLDTALIVPPHREVLGAYGAAIAVHEKMAVRSESSRFRGLSAAIGDRLEYREKTCRADPNCHNRCKLKIYDFDGRKSIWGGDCGRYEVMRSVAEPTPNYFTLRQRLWEKYLAGVCETSGSGPLAAIDGRPTVGLQRALYGVHTAVLWAHFFDRLGLRLVLSPPTNARISAAGVESAAEGTCYPVKVSHGHIESLRDRTAYLFLPTLLNMATPRTSERGAYCPMIRSNAYMIRSAPGLSPARTPIWDPVIHLKSDLDTLAVEVALQMRTRLKAGKRRIKAALRAGLERQQAFAAELRRHGRRILRGIPPAEPVILVTGRPYNLYDERINLRLGCNLSKLGLHALPMDFIDTDDQDLKQFSATYWGLGAQILRTALWIRSQPNAFGLHLTNFGCGADSFLEHFYKHILGDRAYLILELDEHSAVAGVMTRLEAYKNVIESSLKAEHRTVSVRRFGRKKCKHYPTPICGNLKAPSAVSR